MTKQNTVKKIMAMVIALVMIVCAISVAASQRSFAETSGLAAHEQVMDDGAATQQAETVGLEASEQVMDD